MTHGTAGVEALKRFSADRSRSKALQAMSAIEEHLASGDAITVSSIARAAGVSREFIYSHTALVGAIKRAQSTPPEKAQRSVAPSQREESLVAERTILAAKIEQQDSELRAARAAIQDLEKQRERWLGAQLDQLMQPARLDELLSENEQLTRRLLELSRLSQTQAQALLTTREELRIARLAHAETAAEVRDDSRRVMIALRPSAEATD